jgi:3-oxoacyl-[acyl-carrier protein] reductase
MNRPLALITGGTSGIGLGIAKALAPRFDIAITYASNHERARQAEAELRLIGSASRIVAIACELSRAVDTPRLVEAIADNFGESPAVLVNNAGRGGNGLFVASDFEIHERHVFEHLVVGMALTHRFLPDMYRKGFGRIINMSSVSASYAWKGKCGYAAAKSGLEGFTRTLAMEVAHRGITVNAVEPGLIETPMTKPRIDGIKKKNADIGKLIPVGRFGKPGDVGALVEFLCSEKADYITGAILKIDGGMALGDPGSGTSDFFRAAEVGD